MNYSNWLCWKISAQTVAAVTIAVSESAAELLTVSWAKFHSPSHPTLPIDAMRANSAFHAQGPLPRGKYPIVLAWQLQADVHGVGEGMLGLAQWDRALLGLLSGLQLRDAVGVILGRPKPSYSAKPGLPAC